MVGLMSTSSIKEMIDYVHSQDVKIITGTANDPSAIHELVRMGFDGLVPDNPVDLKMAGVEITSHSPQPQMKEFVPPTMSERITTANQSAEQKRAAENDKNVKRNERWQNRLQTLMSLLNKLGMPHRK